MNAKETVDELLKKNREYERNSGPGKNNHVPMVLIAFHRLGGSPELMHRYFDGVVFDQGIATSKPAAEAIHMESWQEHLGRGEFTKYVEFFDDWTNQDPVEEVLKKSVPVLMQGIATAAYHALLRLAYALDYGSREEVASSLAYWAADFYHGPAFDPGETSVEPDVFFREVVRNASTLQIQEAPSIDGRICQVYDSRELAGMWKPIRMDDSDPLESLSALVLNIFAQSQHFTLLHAVTSCQALRRILPYLDDPKKCLTAYWHSVCAAYLTVSRGRFEIGKDTISHSNPHWTEIFDKAMASEHALEHTVKLAYTCWLESQHYGRLEYSGLALRELTKPSPFV